MCGCIDCINYYKCTPSEQIMYNSDNDCQIYYDLESELEYYRLLGLSNWYEMSYNRYTMNYENMDDYREDCYHADECEENEDFMTFQELMDLIEN